VGPEALVRIAVHRWFLTSAVCASPMQRTSAAATAASALVVAAVTQGVRQPHQQHQAPRIGGLMEFDSDGVAGWGDVPDTSTVGEDGTPRRILIKVLATCQYRRSVAVSETGGRFSAGLSAGSRHARRDSRCPSRPDREDSCAYSP
jgi:hypothetical protein